MCARRAGWRAFGNCKYQGWAKPSGMSVYAFGPFILDPAERRLTRDGQRLAVPGKAWQILVMLVEAGGRLVSHETFRDEAVAQRRGRGPHAHRPYVDPAQGAGRRLGRADRDGVRGKAIAWPCRSVRCRRPVGKPRRAADRRRQDACGAALRDARPGRGRQLSRGRYCRRRDHGAGRACLASPFRRSRPWKTWPARARSAWDTCWRARCSAAPSGCASPPA